MYDYPRVTDIIRETNEKLTEDKLRKRLKAIEKNSHYHQANNEASNTATLRGVEVHKEIENFIKTGEFGTTEYFKSVEKWLIRHRINFIACEKQIQSETLKYSGTLDLLLMLNNKPCVLDWITSVRPKRKIFIQKKFIQCAAYAIALEEKVKYEIPILTVVIISPNTIQVFTEDAKAYKIKWIERLNQYYEQLKIALPQNA
jgi:genome maintenance exonuclease 1